MTGRSLWRHADFLRLWIAHSVSLLGSQVTVFAVPLMAILLLHASPVEVGAITACGYLPFLLIGLPVGALVDRWPLRRLLVAVDVGRALVLGCVPVAHLAGALSIGLLGAVMFVHGALTTFADTAHPSYLPALVDNDQLIEGNTKLQTSYSMAELAGPGLGGVLVKLVGAPFALLADAASFVASAAILVGIRRREPARTAAATDRIGPQIREGLSYVTRHATLRALVMCMAGANFFDLYGMVQVILPVYALGELGLSPAVYGAALSVANLGALIGIASNARLVRRHGVGPAIIGASILPGSGVLLLTLATPHTAPVLIMLSLGVAGFGVVVFNVNQLSLRQHVTPLALQGRMNATVRFLIWGMIPAGAFAGGLLSQAIGVRAALVIAGAGSLLSSLPLVRSPLGRVRTMADACEPGV
ncbi:MAG: MFS transporter [Deltaproteobacteria bacterium]|nr:MAG: MFS transporter [Deltaproteobacteria bacterium]